MKVFGIMIMHYNGDGYSLDAEKDIRLYRSEDERDKAFEKLTSKPNGTRYMYCFDNKLR